MFKLLERLVAQCSIELVVMATVYLLALKMRMCL